MNQTVASRITNVWQRVQSHICTVGCTNIMAIKRGEFSSIFPILCKYAHIVHTLDAAARHLSPLFAYKCKSFPYQFIYNIVYYPPFQECREKSTFSVVKGCIKRFVQQKRFVFTTIVYACAFLAERTSIRATQIMLVKYLQGRRNKCTQNKENAVLITRRIELND